MKLDVIGYRIKKAEFINDMLPDTKLNLQIQMSHQIKVPNEFGPKSVGSVITKVMVGTPLQPLYIFMEQVTNFGDVEHDPATKMDSDESMSIFKMICMPVAIEKVEENLNKLCQIYSIPAIKLQKTPPKEDKNYESNIRLKKNPLN